MVVPAEYVHSQKVFCPIALEDFGTDVVFDGAYRVDISTSNNGLEFSEPKQLLVIDSFCWLCNETECQRQVML